jgi:hypothetical protein
MKKADIEKAYDAKFGTSQTAKDLKRLGIYEVP